MPVVAKCQKVIFNRNIMATVAKLIRHCMTEHFSICFLEWWIAKAALSTIVVED